VVKMGFVLVYERLECRSCRWFREGLPFEERLKVPPNLDAVGKCKRKGNIIMRNNGAPIKHCTITERALGNPTPEKVKSVLALKALLHDVQRG
jgi:hypothetical protein